MCKLTGVVWDARNFLKCTFWYQKGGFKVWNGNVLGALFGNTSEMTWSDPSSIFCPNLITFRVMQGLNITQGKYGINSILFLKMQ